MMKDLRIDRVSEGVTVHYRGTDDPGDATWSESGLRFKDAHGRQVFISNEGIIFSWEEWTE